MDSLLLRVIYGITQLVSCLQGKQPYVQLPVHRSRMKIMQFLKEGHSRAYKGGYSKLIYKKHKISSLTFLYTLDSGLSCLL